MAFLFVLFVFLIGIGCTVLWIYCLVDIIRADFKGENDKIIWLLLIIFLPLIGSILYLAIGMKQKIPESIV
jgi:hypothetical protein